MAQLRRCTTLTGKYLRRHRRHKRLSDNEQTIEHLRFCFQLNLDQLDLLHFEEQQLTAAQLAHRLDLLWSSFRITAEHLKRIVG